MGDTVSLPREPDAVNPPVRFDERDVETEHGSASEAPANERAGKRIGRHLNHRATSRLYIILCGPQRKQYWRKDFLIFSPYH